MFSKVPSGCVRPTDAVEHGSALSADVPRDQCRMNVLVRDRYRERNSHRQLPIGWILR